MRTLPLALLALVACRNKDYATPVDSVGRDDSAVTGDDSASDDSASDDSASDDSGAGDDADGDGVPDDEDCDPGDASVGAPVAWYPDGDGDGYGRDGEEVTGCEAPEGHVDRGGDCDDADAAYNPGAEEADCADPNDYNCDGSVGFADGDGDGYAACEDCDDADAGVNPGAAEVCDERDEDCDGAVDEGVTTTWYVDADGDGWGDIDFPAEACEAPEGYAATPGDCDDGARGVNPGATEVCDGVDGDCDGAVDEGAADAGTWYADVDGDGYGDAGSSQQACAAPSGTVADATDCDDGDGGVNPGATEVCDGLDDDCDGLIDDDDPDLDLSTGATWYADADGDGYGDAGAGLLACDAPSGTVADATDCDDGDGGVNPGATEVCDGEDQDCSGAIDDGGVCPCDVEEYGGHAYMFCATAQAWPDAEATCLTYGYGLAAVNDAAEDAWMDGEADARSTLKWWIGLNDRDVEGTFTWSNGDAVTYTNWAAGEPNDAGGNEDCGQLNRYTDGTWNDEPCASAFYFVCEHP